MNLSSNMKVTKVSGAVADGTSAVNCTVLDMQGFEGVCFIGLIETANAGNGIKAQQGEASNMSDAADLAGTLVAGETDLVLDIYHPMKRYLRAVVIRAGASTVVDSVYAVQYGARKLPVDNVNANQAAELHVSPVEGTA